MVNELSLTPRGWKRVVPRLRTKLNNCNTPYCWEIRKPVESNQKLYLSPSDTGRKKGYYASVRRILFLWEYDTAPVTQIKMECGNSNCCNPAHARIPGFEELCDKRIPDQIRANILSEDDAERMFRVPFTRKERKGSTKAEEPTQEPAAAPTELTEQELRDAQEARQYLNVLSPSQ